MEAIMGRIRTNGTRPSTASQITKPIGVTSQREKFSTIQEDFLADWSDIQSKVTSVNRMVKNSPLIGGALRLAIEMSIRQVDWFFSSDEGEDDPNLDFVRESWENLTHTWDEHISDAVLSAFYGWATFTNQYERVNGRLLWHNFKYLLPDTLQDWIYDDMGRVVGLKQYTYLWPEPIPADRLLIYRFRYNGNNPEGESVLRPAWTSYFYGANLEDIRAIGYERHAAGMPMVKMPLGADPSESGDDFKQASKIARNIRVDEQGGLVIPPPTGDSEAHKWDVDLMSAGNAQVFMALNSTIAEYDKKIMMSALAQFIILGMANVGTQAKAESDVSFFTMSVNAFADNLAETFTKNEIPRLGRFNGMDLSAISLDHSPAGDVDTNVFIELIKATGGKINWTPEDEVQLRSIFDLPDKTVEEIEAEAERKQAMLPPQFPRPQLPPVPTDDEMTVYATPRLPPQSVAGNAPDERKRREMERLWLQRMVKYG